MRMGRDDEVAYEIDPMDPPPFTDSELAQLTALARIPDEAIDMSDLPTLGEDFFARAVRNPYWRPVDRG